MISIVIPVHNERQNLSRLLPRLLQLGQGLHIELIPVLSAATSDGSGEQARELGVVPLRCEHSSRAHQMNRGAGAATGDVLVFLHADTWPPDRFFSDISQTLTGGYQAGFFSYRFDSGSRLLRVNSWFTRRDGIFTGGGDQCLFIRKSVFEELGRFDTRQVLMEDFEFFRRMKQHAVAYRIVPNDLVVSARKYRANSYMRVNLANLLLLLLFRLGCPPGTLKRYHDGLLASARGPDQED